MDQQDSKPYYYVRFGLDRGIDLKVLAEELESSFEVEWFSIERTKEEFSLFKDESVELKVRADTLRAFVSSVRVVLYQKVRSPFTLRDLELRKKLMEWFPQKRMSPLPFLLKDEPKFEVAKADARDQNWQRTLKSNSSLLTTSTHWDAVPPARARVWARTRVWASLSSGRDSPSPGHSRAARDSRDGFLIRGGTGCPRRSRSPATRESLWARAAHKTTIKESV